MITGNHELDVKDLRDKLGSMADSTKCCATGTCDNYLGAEVNAPLIPLERDTRDAFEVYNTIGSL